MQAWKFEKHMRLLLNLSLFVLLASARPLGAQQGYAAAADTESNNQHKLVAAEGSLYLTYSRAVGGMPRVFVGVSADGRTWRSLGRVSEGGGAATLSTLAVDRRGRLHVAWTDFSGGAGSVYYRAYDRSWGLASRLSAGLPYAGYPSMDVDSRNRLHLVWYGIREASQGQPAAHGAIYEIYYLRHTAGWSRPLRLSGGFPDAVNPALAVGVEDRVHVAWFQSDGQAFQIMYTRHDADWRTPQQLTSGTSPSTKPAIAVDAAGRVHLVWERLRGGRTVVEYMRGEGDRWTAAEEISASGSRHPTVGLWARGVFALWQDRDGAVVLRVFDGRWGPPRSIGRGDYPSATPWKPTPGARPHAAWTSPAGVRVVNLEPLLGRP